MDDDLKNFSDATLNLLRQDGVLLTSFPRAAMVTLREAQNRENAARQQLSEAATAYERAATLLAADKVYLSAADAYECAHRCSSSPDAFLLRKAAQRCRQGKPPKITPLVLAEKRAAIYIHLQPAEAAAEQQRIAELYEKEELYEQAADEFKEAANRHKAAGSEASALHCWERSAHHTASMEEFGVAGQLFERLASHQSDPESASTSRFHGVLCYIANGDGESARHLMLPDLLHSLSPAKAALLSALVAQLDGFNSNFYTAIITYNNATELNTWITRLLYKCREQLDH